MMSPRGEDGRKSDILIGQLLGEFKEFKEGSFNWREKTDQRLILIESFINEIREPKRAILWTMRAIVIAAIGSLVVNAIAFIKDHLNWN